MAKNSKKSKAAATNGIAPVPAIDETQSGARAPTSETSPGAKTSRGKAATRAKSGGKTRVGSTRRAMTGEKSKKVAARKTSAPAAAAISDNDIRLRAYFISEWRIQNGIAGDSVHDWWEARRQLQEEASRSA